MPFTRIAVSWSRWTHVPADLDEDKISEDMIDAQRDLLTATIERARLHALNHFGKPAHFGNSDA
jgi:hypothetical protein